jgi:steroid 5-alpha reductase family enzyme
MDLVAVLAINLVVCCGAMLLLWLVCVAMKDVTVIDSWWAFGMVLLAVSTYLQTGGNPERKLLLLGLCTVWGVRLGGYLLWRWRGHGVDKNGPKAKIAEWQFSHCPRWSKQQTLNVNALKGSLWPIFAVRHSNWGA